MVLLFVNFDFHQDLVQLLRLVPFTIDSVETNYSQPIEFYRLSQRRLIDVSML